MFSFGKSFAQAKINCCPVYKGKILVDNSYKTMGGKLVPRAEISSKRRAVYSASPGVVASMDTSAIQRIYIRVEYLNYTYTYENIKSSECFVGQNIKTGMLVGRLEEGENLYLSISDGKRLIHPESVLSCKE